MVRQHPCSACGKELKSDDMFDLVLTRREPREYRRSSRSTAQRYLPPNRWTVDHLYLCDECGQKVSSFMDTLKEGGLGNAE